MLQPIKLSTNTTTQHHVSQAAAKALASIKQRFRGTASFGTAASGHLVSHPSILLVQTYIYRIWFESDGLSGWLIDVVD